MTQTLLVKLKAWNKRANDLPRKGLLILATILIVLIAVLLISYCWPFLIALLCAMLLEKFVSFADKGIGRVRLKRAPAALLGMLLLFGLLGLLFFALTARLGRELMGLVRSVPQVIAWLSDVALPYARELYGRWSDILPESAMGMLQDAFSSFGQSLLNLAGKLSGLLTSGAWSTALSIPRVLLSVVLIIMGTYYLTADRARVLGFLRRTIPSDARSQARLMRDNLLKALFGQVRSQLIVSLIVTLFLLLMFSVFGVRYGLLIALLIGLADALPVVGAGLFLIPLSLFAFITGDIRTGVLMALTYIGTIVLRQVFEPRIVGRNLGLHPLATMIAMYAGYTMFGFIGLLGGPILLNILKVVLEADQAKTAVSKEN